MVDENRGREYRGVWAWGNRIPLLPPRRADTWHCLLVTVPRRPPGLPEQDADAAGLTLIQLVPQLRSAGSKLCLWPDHPVVLW